VPLSDQDRSRWRRDLIAGHQMIEAGNAVVVPSIPEPGEMVGTAVVSAVSALPACAVLRGERERPEWFRRYAADGGHYAQSGG
jgi:predicted RNA polymerase sigma factor